MPLIPGRTRRGEGSIISFTDGQVWGRSEFLHSPGEEPGGSEGTEWGAKENSPLDALCFAGPPTSHLTKESHLVTVHWRLVPTYPQASTLVLCQQ